MHNDLQRLAHELLVLSESNNSKIDRLIDHLRREREAGSTQPYARYDSLHRVDDDRGWRDAFTVRHR